jgi:hypothetical protein
LTYATDSNGAFQLGLSHAVGMNPEADSSIAANVIRQIRVIRGQRVLLDSDLAMLYGVSTKCLTKRFGATRIGFPAIS